MESKLDLGDLIIDLELDDSDDPTNDSTNALVDAIPNEEKLSPHKHVIHSHKLFIATSNLSLWVTLMKSL